MFRKGYNLVMELETSFLKVKVQNNYVKTLFCQKNSKLLKI